MQIDQLYQNATEALDAIVKYRAAERAGNADLTRIGVTTLRKAEPSEATLWHFYKAASQVFDEPEVAETFAILCDEAGVDAEGYPADEDTGMSDVEFDYRAAIGWPQAFRA